MEMVLIIILIFIVILFLIYWILKIINDNLEQENRNTLFKDEGIYNEEIYEE